MRKNTITSVVVIVAALTITAPALAEADSVAVAYGDLDLSTQADAKILADRIDQAARRACGGSPRFDQDYRLAHAAVNRAFEACHDRAVAHAQADMRTAHVAQARAADASAD